MVNDEELEMQRKKIFKMLEYHRILDEHGFNISGPKDELPSVIDDFCRIVETLPLLAARVAELDKIHNGMGALDPETRDSSYDCVRLLANLCVFTDKMKPIADKYNPSKEDRSKLAEFIMNNHLGEENNDDI